MINGSGSDSKLKTHVQTDQGSNFMLGIFHSNHPACQ